MVTEIYPILPTAISDSPDTNMAKVRESLRALEIGQAFLIPATELADGDGRWRTTTLGSRVHQSARRMGIQVRTLKVTQGECGLQVQRIA